MVEVQGKPGCCHGWPHRCGHLVAGPGLIPESRGVGLGFYGFSVFPNLITITAEPLPFLEIEAGEVQLSMEAGGLPE